jgi:hypothetical protein
MYVQGKYYAKEEKDSYDVKKLIITYFFYAGETPFSKKAFTGGRLKRTYVMDEDRLFRSLHSPKDRERIVANDYNVITQTLESLATEIKEKCKKDGIEFYTNDDSNVEGPEGCRKFKGFEKKLFLDALEDK